MRRDKISKEFRVKDLKRKRAEALESSDDTSLARQFEITCVAVVNFLDSREPAEAAGPEEPAEG